MKKENMSQELLDTSKIRKLLFLGPRGSYSDFAKNLFIEKNQGKKMKME